MDYKSVFTNLCLELQQNRSWIKGLGKIHKRVNSFTDCSAFCPGAPKRVPSDSAKHRRVYTPSNICHSHEWRVDTASGKTLKKRNACLHAVRQAVEKKLRVYTASEAKGLKPSYLKYEITKISKAQCHSPFPDYLDFDQHVDSSSS